jgi:hypothetical protein
VEERPNSQTEPHGCQTRARHRGFGRRGEQSGREIGSSPGAPRELNHAGGVEGAGAPAPRGGGDKAVREEERDRGGEEEVAVESHGAARWEEGEAARAWGRRSRVPGLSTVQEPTQRGNATDSGPDNTWTPIVSDRRERSWGRALPSRSGSFQTHAGGALFGLNSVFIINLTVFIINLTILDV